MKQHITLEQLKELNEKEEVRLVAWMRAKGYEGIERRALPSIGQMIEYLDEHGKLILEHEHIDDWDGWGISLDKIYKDHNELCDALWSAVRDLLEREE